MKIQKTIFLSAFFTIFYAQSMEMIQPKNNKNIPTLKLDHSIINTLINESKKNRSNPSLFSRRTKRLQLLQQLLNEKTEISFSNNNNTIIFWRDKDDASEVQKILYEQLLSFISCSPSKHTVRIQHTPFSERQSFNATLELKCSLLRITISHFLTYQLRDVASKFLDQYNSNKCRYYAQYNIPIQQQNMKMSEEKTYDDTSLLATLPDNTQELLLEIINDMNNAALQ